VPRFVLVDRFGHVVWESDTAPLVPLTPREELQARNDARLRWQRIVDLELRGQRLTGYGKVVSR